MPSAAHNRESASCVAARERGTRSLDLTTTGNDLGQAPSGIDIGSILTDQDAAGSVTTEQLTGVSDAHPGKHSKHSVFGSLKQRLTRGYGSDHTTKNTLNVTRLISEDHPHASGDRYPSTALSPPTGYNVDEVCSRFSDESSDRERRAARGQRWTGLRGKHRNAALHDQAVSPNATDSFVYDAGAINQDRIGARSASHTINAVGMGRAEFHFKRFGEKVRNLIARGGELLRTLSTRSRSYRPRSAVRNEWLEDSLYSGV